MFNKNTAPYSGDNSNNINIAVGDLTIQNILDGVDPRDLADYLDKILQEGLTISPENQPQILELVKEWYRKREIEANLKEALGKIIEFTVRNNQELFKISQDLQTSNQNILAQAFIRLQEAIKNRSTSK